MTVTILVVVALMSLAQSPVSSGPSEPIDVEAIVDAPVGAVWDAFTTKAGIESWMTAAGDVDLRIGGLMKTSYRRGADLNGDTAIHQSILSIDPGRMLSFRTVKSPKDFPFADVIAQTWTVIYMEPAGAGRTKVTARMLGYTSAPDSQKMRAFFKTGNKATLDSLVKTFAIR